MSCLVSCPKEGKRGSQAHNSTPDSFFFFSVVIAFTRGRSYLVQHKMEIDYDRAN